MTTPKQHERAVPLMKEHPLQRPKTLLQRLSLGIVHALPSLRSSSSKIDLIDRPATAPNHFKKRADKAALVASTEQLLNLDPSIVAAGESAPPCPCEPDSCHPFASIEKRRCNFCGMRGPKIVQHEPCHACKTGSPGSHINFVGTHRRRSAVDTRHLTHLDNSSDSVLLGPRPVTPERAAKRIGNPPRVSRLSPGIVRLPAPNAANTTPPHEFVERLPSRLGVGPSNRERYTHLQGSHDSTVASSTKKPTSPKLHHLSLLPHSGNYPFVHRHEIPKHAIALRAGSSSPLTDRSNSSGAAHNNSKTTDYSDTVYYGDRRPSRSSHLVDFKKPQTTTVVVKQVQANERASIDLYASPLDTALAESEVYKERSPKHTSVQPTQGISDISDSTTTFDSQDTDSTKMGDMRLELKGGSSDAGKPRLRGGSGFERASTNTFAFKLKRWILLCHTCHRYHSDSDDDVPPARVVTPERVAKMRQRMNGRAPLPAHLCRGTSSVTSSSSATQMPRVSKPNPTAAAKATTVFAPSKWSHASCLSLSSLYHRQCDSHVNQPTPVTPAQILNPPYPRFGVALSHRVQYLQRSSGSLAAQVGNPLASADGSSRAPNRGWVGCLVWLSLVTIMDKSIGWKRRSSGTWRSNARRV